jgi:hypothetical protein
LRRERFVELYPVEDTPSEADPLAQKLIRMLAGQFVVELPYGVAPVCRRPVVSESDFGRMMSGFLGTLRRVAL